MASDTSWGVVSIGSIEGVAVELSEGEVDGHPVYELELDHRGQWKVYIRVDSPAVLQLLRGFLGAPQPGARLTLGYLDQLQANLACDADGAWKLQVSGQRGGVLFEQRWSPELARQFHAAVSEAIDTTL